MFNLVPLSSTESGKKFSEFQHCKPLEKLAREDFSTSQSFLAAAALKEFLPLIIFSARSFTHLFTCCHYLTAFVNESNEQGLKKKRQMHSLKNTGEINTFQIKKQDVFKRSCQQVYGPLTHILSLYLTI